MTVSSQSSLKPPLTLALVLSLWLGVGAVSGALRLIFRTVSHTLPLYYQPEHLHFSIAERVASIAIDAVVAFLLWKMARGAFKVWLLHVSITLYSFVYLGFIFPDVKAISMRHSVIFLPVVASGLLYEFVVLFLVWLAVVRKEQQQISELH